MMLKGCYGPHLSWLALHNAVEEDAVGVLNMLGFNLCCRRTGDFRNQVFLPVVR